MGRPDRGRRLLPRHASSFDRASRPPELGRPTIRTLDPMMINHRAHALRMGGLAFWQRPIVVEPLPGGITNHNYLVRDARGAYVARMFVERPLLGIDRRNEVVCQRAAHA